MLDGQIGVVTRLGAEVTIGGVGIMPGRQPIYVSSDNIIAFGPLRDTLNLLTAAQIAAASGMMTLYGSDGNAVSGATSLPLSLFSGSSNRFYAAIENTVTLTDGADYYVIATITAGGVTLTVRELLTARYRT